MATIREMIQETVAKLDPKKFSEQDRKMQEELLIKIFEEDMVPKDAVGLTKEVMEALYSYTYRLYTSGKYENAVNMFCFLLSLDSGNPRYAFGLGASYHMMKEYKKAIDGYMLCAFLQPNLPIPYYHMCDCYTHLDDKWCAIFCLRSAVKLGQENMHRYNKLTERCVLMLSSLEKEMYAKEGLTKEELERESSLLEQGAKGNSSNNEARTAKAM